MPLQEFIDTPSLNPVQFEIEPAINAFQSLVLINKESAHSTMSEWVTSTVQAMTQEERETNELVVLGLHYASLPGLGWESFPAYVQSLAAMPPKALRDKMLAVYDSMPLLEYSGPVVDLPQALTSADQYLAFLNQRFWAKNVDEALERQAFNFVSDPPAMQRLIVDHLTNMWQKYLSAEWERVRPMLVESARAFRQVDFGGRSLYEAANIVAGRELPEEKWEPTFEVASKVVFVPNAHLGPYLFRICINEAEPVILFGARLPEESTVEMPDLSRAEVVMRLSALADDTRLRILRLIAERGEVRSQDVMEAFDLSQPAASRHLTQLAANGYLRERRCDGAKCYSLNADRINETFRALSNFLMIGERSRI